VQQKREFILTVRTNKYLDNLIEQDHRAIKRRCASMAGFKSFRTRPSRLPASSLLIAFARNNSLLGAVVGAVAGR
jgi:putative transposase